MCTPDIFKAGQDGHVWPAAGRHHLLGRCSSRILCRGQSWRQQLASGNGWTVDRVCQAYCRVCVLSIPQQNNCTIFSRTRILPHVNEALKQPSQVCVRISDVKWWQLVTPLSPHPTPPPHLFMLIRLLELYFTPSTSSIRLYNRVTSAYLLLFMNALCNAPDGVRATFRNQITLKAIRDHGWTSIAFAFYATGMMAGYVNEARSAQRAWSQSKVLSPPC